MMDFPPNVVVSKGLVGGDLNAAKTTPQLPVPPAACLWSTAIEKEFAALVVYE